MVLPKHPSASAQIIRMFGLLTFYLLMVQAVFSICQPFHIESPIDHFMLVKTPSLGIEQKNGFILQHG